MPFAQAATGYALLTGVAVSAKTVERLAERYGAQLAAEDAAVVAHISTAAHQVPVPDAAPATTAPCGRGGRRWHDGALAPGR